MSSISNFIYILIKYAIKEKKQREEQEEQGTLRDRPLHQLRSRGFQGQGHQALPTAQHGRRLLKERYPRKLRIQLG